MREKERLLISAWDRLLCRKGATIALVEAEWKRSYSFVELNDLADAWSKRLEGRNLERRSVVIHLPNSADWLGLLIALRRQDAVVIAVDHGWPVEKAAEVALRFRAVLSINPSGITEREPPHRRWKDGSALVKLTSGSTGAPKGIVFSDAELIADAFNVLESMGIAERDRNFCLHPLSHSYALGNVVIPLIAFGVSAVIGSSPFPHVISEEAVSSGATVLPTVPSVLEALCKSTVDSLSPIRLIISAAARLSPDLASAFFEKFGQKIHNFYGSSETGGIAYDRSGELGLKGTSVGAPLDNVEVSMSKSGRLKVRSLAVSHYGKRTDSDKPICFLLSDLAEIATDGSIILKGRADRVEKIAGKRIDLEATEQALVNIFSLSHAAVFKRGDQLQVVIEGQPLDMYTVKTWLTSALGRKFSLSTLSKIPLTPRGKTDYRRLAVLVS